MSTKFKLVVKNKGDTYEKYFPYQKNAEIYVLDFCINKPHAFLLATLYENDVAIGWFDAKGVFTPF